MDLVHLHPLEFELTSKASLASLSPLELALVQLHPNTDDQLTHHARKLWHHLRLKAEPHEIAAFSSTRAPVAAAPSGTSFDDGFGRAGDQHQHQPQQQPHTLQYPSTQPSQRYRNPLPTSQRSVPAAFAELVDILRAEGRRGNSQPLVEEAEYEWTRKTRSDRQSFKKHLLQAEGAGVVKKWKDRRTGDEWLELVSESTPPPASPPSPPPQPIKPVLTSTNFHLADLDFPLPPSLEALSSAQLVCLQFREGFFPKKIWDDHGGLTGEQVVEDLLLKRATRDRGKGLRWKEVASSSRRTSMSDSRRSSATAGASLRSGSFDHPPPTPDSPPTSFHELKGRPEPLPPSQRPRRRSSRSRSPPPRKTKSRLEDDRCPPDARRLSRNYSPEETQSIASLRLDAFDTIPASTSPSDLGDDLDERRIPRALSDSFYTLRVTTSSSRLDREAILDGLPRRLAPDLLDLKPMQGWLAWRNEDDAADARECLNQQLDERLDVHAHWAKSREWLWVAVHPSLRLRLRAEAEQARRKATVPSEDERPSKSSRKSAKTESVRIKRRESCANLRQDTPEPLDERSSSTARSAIEVDAGKEEQREHRVCVLPRLLRTVAAIITTIPIPIPIPIAIALNMTVARSARRRLSLQRTSKHRRDCSKPRRGHRSPAPARRDQPAPPSPSPRRPSPSRRNEGRFSPPPRQHSSPPPRSPSQPPLDPLAPVPVEIIKTLPQLRLSFSSLPRDLLHQDALHVLFCERFRAVGWQYESPRRFNLIFLLVFHGQKDLDAATRWFQGPAAAYWSSNHLGVQPIHPNAIEESWTWSKMTKAFRESWGIYVETRDPGRRCGEGKPWREFGWEIKKRIELGERDARFESTRWAPPSLARPATFAHPALGAEQYFWSGPSAASRRTWIANTMLGDSDGDARGTSASHDDMDRPQDETKRFQLDYYGPPREEPQQQQSGLQEGEIVDPPSVAENALDAAFARSPSPLNLDHDQELKDCDQSLLNHEHEKATDSQAPLDDPSASRSSHDHSHPAIVDVTSSSNLVSASDSNPVDIAGAVQEGASEQELIAEVGVEMRSESVDEGLADALKEGEGEEGMVMKCEGGEVREVEGEVEVEIEEKAEKVDATD
ncbi:hypothetical protein BCR35DRAFT_333391 [Leucosporidium creatinivorum]|uniref:Uncharacterized protein n=1 Tax=Leucosporidium creatinivorum TaxID=106004 RepID=A0A1Y2ETB8_9BASI|nr:hypothetical protein BCR35DRAFT_333391 [Leucosporidium creatinivorum]